jgi:type 1 glutamine amidotransferase
MKHVLVILLQLMLVSMLPIQLIAQPPADYPASYASGPRFKMLIYYTTHAEGQHVDFAKQAITFFQKLKFGDGFILDTTQDLSLYPYEKLQQYQLLIMLDGYPTAETERKTFEQYMENGGGWMGFHASGYNDKTTHWPWFVQFLGGGVFYCNNWPPQPAKLVVDHPGHPVTQNLPTTYIAPASEWYQWNPSPRTNKDVDVLLSLSSDNYPFGIKDVIYSGDSPVVWTNKKYRMIYLNMGHGDEVLSDATQKLMIINAFKWVLSTDKKGNPFKK